MPVHGEIWTVKELFVYPNEFIIWSIQIVMYPFMTGLVAGAFVLSSLYHVFGRQELKNMARFSLIFSFALLPVAMLPLQLHLQHPLRGIHVFLTPHFTSAIAAFGVVFSTYGAIVAAEIWFLNREYFITEGRRLKDKDGIDKLKGILYRVLCLGSHDVSPSALEADHRAVKLLAAVGIPVACFLHGYAGFIFGSVKANALWMTPLMPVIFIMSAIVSGIALSILTYITVLQFKKLRAVRSPLKAERMKSISKTQLDAVLMTKKYLMSFLIAAISLELLDLIFRGYTAVKSWDILRAVIYEHDFYNIFVLQYGLGNLLPFIMLMLPGLTLRRTVVALLLVLFGVFMMRWNVVIGGQSFSLTFSGFMRYAMPVVPHDIETFKEGLAGALLVLASPFAIFAVLSRLLPVMSDDD